MYDFGVIAVENQKGGTGKTTITLCLAARYVNLGYRTLVIDCDWGQESALDYGTITEGKYFHVVRLKAAQLKSYIADHKEFYDRILLDCPPRANADAGKFIQVAHLILIPIQPSPFDVWGSQQLIEIVQARRDATAGIPDMPKGGLPHAAFVLSNAAKNIRLVDETIDAIGDTGFITCKSGTTPYQIYRRALGDGKTIFDYHEKNTKAEQEIIDLVVEIEEIIKP